MLYDVKKADIFAQSDYQRTEKLRNLAIWQQLYEEIVTEGQCVSLKTLAVTGSDLIAHGMKPGKLSGTINCTVGMLFSTVLTAYQYKNMMIVTMCLSSATSTTIRNCWEVHNA
jgi:tRNA nucleotidyltransferase (CCA-adding enzyme)